MPDKPSKIRVERLVKIFGGPEGLALDRLRAGDSREEIQRRLGSVTAVADVSFSVQEGEVFVVMGLSGSGKSTLVRCINRIIQPTDGGVFLDEENLLSVDQDRLRALRRTKIAMVFQHFALFPHKSVAGNVEYGLKIQGMARIERRERALKALDLVGLRKWADAAPDALSGGMRQRVGLARALAVDPEILLMDEPFGALDPLIRREMQHELLGLQERVRKTIVFITHDLHEALFLGDRISIMKDGRFVQTAKPSEIVSNPADTYVEAFTQDVDRGRLFSVNTVMLPQSTKIREADTLETVIRLGCNPSKGVYVVNDQHAPVGLVWGPGLHYRGNPADTVVNAIMRREFPHCLLGTPISEIYHLCAAGLPIAVVDEKGCFQGVAHPLDVFAKLAGREPPADRDPTEPEPVPVPRALRLVTPSPNQRKS